MDDTTTAVIIFVVASLLFIGAFLMLVYSLCFAEKPLLMIKVARGNEAFCPNMGLAQELESQQNGAYRKSSINEGTQTTDFNPYRSTMSSNHSIYTGQSTIYRVFSFEIE